MAQNPKEKLNQLLVRKHALTAEKLEEAFKVQKEKKERIGDILVRLGHISKDNLLEVLSAELGVPPVYPAQHKVPPEVISLVPKKMAELYCLLPVAREDSLLSVAIADPLNIHAIDDLRRL